MKMLLLLLFVMSSCCAFSNESNITKTSQKISNYTIQIKSYFIDNDPEEEHKKIEIFKKGKLVFSSLKQFPENYYRDIRFAIEPIKSDKNAKDKDIVVFEAYSGGSNCCFDYIILYLGAEKIVISDIIESQSFPGLKVLNNQNPVSIAFYDGVWCDFIIPTFEIRPPRVIYTFSNLTHSFKSNFSLMKKISKVTEDMKLAWLKKSKESYIDCDLNNKTIKISTFAMNKFLEFQYQGEYELALYCLNKSWKGSKKDLKNFLHEIALVLKKSVIDF